MEHLVGGISSAGRAVPDLDGERFAVSHARGPFVFDGAGRRYIDTAMGFGAVLLGHAHAEVNAAVCEAIAKGSMPAFAHPAEEEAAAALCAPCGPLSRAIFTNTGSEAVHLACRIARAVTGRPMIAKVGAGFDGWYDDVALANAGAPNAVWADGRRPVQGRTTVIRFNDPADVLALFAERDDIAAIIIEPMLANAGCIEPDPDWLAAVQAAARGSGALLIADEVLMGFRQRFGLTSQGLGLDPDLATVGKAVANGFAAAAVLGRAEVMAAVTDGRAIRAGTYSGSPVAVAAVRSALAVLSRQDYAMLQSRGQRIRERLAQIAAEIDLPLSTSGLGSVFTTWFAASAPQTYEAAAAQADARATLALHLALRRRGVMTMPFPYGRVFLSFAHDDAVCDMLCDAYREALFDLHRAQATA